MKGLAIDAFLGIIFKFRCVSSNSAFGPCKTDMSVTAAEVAQHSSDSDCWVIVGDDVYDVTNFWAEYPGGKKSIILFAGKDVTEEFDMLHERKVIKKYGIDQGKVAHKGKLSK